MKKTQETERVDHEDSLGFIAADQAARQAIWWEIADIRRIIASTGNFSKYAASHPGYTAEDFKIYTDALERKSGVKVPS